MPKKPTPFEDAYPSITKWIKFYGWLEVGHDENSTSFIRVLDEGGLVWESARKYPSLDVAWHDLEVKLQEVIDEIG